CERARLRRRGGKNLRKESEAERICGEGPYLFFMGVQLRMEEVHIPFHDSSGVA
uniref:Uncharacterized protein n=1 Tax=Cucumis melo TaxID=3656 RepID=A0A9I9EGX2_CUCME